MSTFAVAPGSLVAFEEADWLIEKVETFERVLAKRIEDGRREFLAISALRPPKWSGDDVAESNAKRIPRQLPEQELQTPEQTAQLEAAVAQFQAALAIIEAPKASRAALIAEYCKTFNCSPAATYRHMGHVRRQQKAEVLLRAQRSDIGKGRVGSRAEEIISEYLAKYRLIPEKHTIPDVLERVNGALRAESLKEVSTATLYRRLGLISHRRQLLAEGRKKEARDSYRPRTGHLPDADFPLAIIQVDHTPIQVCLVDEVDRKPIGDAWITLVIDCYSRMVLGFCLSLDAPSTLTTGLGLAHAFLPKDQYLVAQGVSGTWPCWGAPDVILVDNAVELNGHMMHSARRRFRFVLRDRPIGGPNFGGHVESAFRTFMFETKTIEGTKFSNPTERAQYDSEGKAIMTLSAYEKYFTEFLVNDYHLRGHSGEGMNGRTPLQRWQAGIFDGDVREPTGLPDIPVDPEHLRISMMPFKMRTISNARVQMFGREEYFAQGLKAISDAISVNASEDERKVEVRFDPRDISCVWVYDKVSDSYIKALNNNVHFRPISKWEHDAKRKAQRGQADVFKDDRLASMHRRDEIKAEEKKKTKEVRREEERRRRNSVLALTTQGKPSQPPVPAPTMPLSLDPARLAELRAGIKTTADNYNKD